MFELIIRWHSGIGQECEKKVKEFIKETQQKAFPNQRDRGLPPKKTIIDFNIFTFVYNTTEYTLSDFVNVFKVSTKILDMHDLSGINLSSIRIDQCLISDCFFAWADFSHSTIKCTDFSHCLFTKANFDYSQIRIVRYYDGTSFGKISVKNAYINGTDLKGFTNLKNIKEVSYYWLIKEVFKA